MDYQPNNQRLLIGFAAAILILTGCAPEMRRPPKAYPVKKSLTEALSTLSSRSKNAPPFKATGQCRLYYYLEGKKHKENFPAKLWGNPPVEIYLQGDIAFDPQGLLAGSNKNEFWLAIKPKEISSYWWGQWAGDNFPSAGQRPLAEARQKLMLSPKTVLEALGIIEIASEQNWTLSHHDHLDLLTRYNQQGTPTQKMYIYSDTNYLVERIEYLNSQGQPVVVTELNNYRELIEGIFVPTTIEISTHIEEGYQDKTQITLSSIKPTEITDKQRSRLFTRPQPQGFKHIYKIVDGDIIEQTQ